MKISIIGNCQAQALETMFTMHSDITVNRLPAVHLLKPSDEDLFSKSIEGSDIIFTQQISDNYEIEFVRTSNIKEKTKEILVVPNIYFNGYFPDIQYIYRTGIGKLVGPLDDYHPMGIYNSYKEGKSISQTLELYQSVSLDAVSADPFEASISELRRREEQCDIIISDFIDRNCRDRRLFYTVNHPTNSLLAEMARRMAVTIGHHIDVPSSHPYALSRINIPIYPRSLVKAPLLEGGSIVGISRQNFNVSIGATVAHTYESFESMIEHFYIFYRSVDDYEKLEISV